MELYSNVVYDPADYVFIRFSDISVDTMGPRVWAPNPGFGADDIAISSNICFDLLDPESGVDASTIRLFFGPDGGLVREISDEDFTVTPLSTGYRICYDPATLLMYNTLYRVRVQANDTHTPPNSGGGEWTFRTTNTDAPTFELGIQVCDITTDTTCGVLMLGTDPDALVGRDDMDVPVPVLPPSGFVPYFPIDDPIYDYLTTDFRPTAAGAQMWEVALARPSGSGLITWDRAEVLVDPDWMLGIAVAAIGEVPTDDDFRMNDMAAISSMEYTGGERAWVKLLATDPTGPGTSCITGIVDFYGDDEETAAEITVDPVGASAMTAAGGGTFEICGLPNEDFYTVIISAEGYVAETMFVELDTMDLDLGTIELRPPGVWVHGVVTVEGDPAPGITVTLGGDVDITNGSGEYEFDDVMPGEYIIEFSGFGPGYPDTSFTVTIPDDVEEYVINFDYEMPLLSISGHVTLGGVAGEGVTLEWCDEPGVAIATTDSMGYYIIEDLTPDNYCIRAVADGYESEIQYVFVDDHIEDVDFDLSRGLINISGTITSACGESVFGTVVSITGGASEVVTGAGGAFMFRDLDWGEYTIEATLDYHAVIDTIVDASGDITVNIELPCLSCVTAFTVTPDEIERPIPSGDMLSNELSWTAPTTDLTILRYDLYKDGVDIADIDAGETTYSDTDVMSEVNYEYQLVVVYDVEGENTESDMCMMGEGMPMEYPDPSQILIIDYDGGDTPVGGVGAEQSIENLLDSPTLAYTGGYTVTDQDPADLDGYDLNDYDMVIVSMGEEETSAIDDDILNVIIAYMEEPFSAVYVEGPDFGELYGGVSGIPRHFYNHFGISWAPGHDDSPVDTLRGTVSVFDMYLKGSYPGGTDVDDILLTDARNALYSQDDLVRASMYVEDANKKRIASTIYVGNISAAGGYAISERILGTYLFEAGIPNESIRELPTDVLPTEYEIGKVYPNPFNPVTSIEFNVPEASTVQIAVLDAQGRMVEMLYSGNLEAGVYRTSFNGQGLTSGTYYARMTADGVESSARMILLK